MRVIIADHPHRFYAMKFYRKTATATEIVKELKQLEAQDKIIEGQVRRYKIITIVSIVMAFLGFFIVPIMALALATIAGPGALGIITLLYIIAVLFGGIYGGIQWWNYHRLDLEDRRILTALKFARVIGLDLKRGTPLDMAVSFEDYRAHGKVTAGNQSSGKFVDDWFQARGRLADNTSFELSVRQKVSRKERRKRKYTKVKESFQELLFVQLSPKTGLFPHLDRFAAALNEAHHNTIVATKKKAYQIRNVAVKNGSVLVSADTGHYRKIKGRGTQESGKENLVTADHLLQIMLESYTALRRCK